MEEEQKVSEIHELIKKHFPDAVSVSILVNSQGIEFLPKYRTNVNDFSMRTITGRWVKRAES